MAATHYDNRRCYWIGMLAQTEEGKAALPVNPPLNVPLLYAAASEVRVSRVSTGLLWLKICDELRWDGITPQELVDAPASNPYHWTRVNAAEPTEQNPLLTTVDASSGLVLLSGAHRLTRAHHDNIATISVRILPPTLVAACHLTA